MVDRRVLTRLQEHVERELAVLDKYRHTTASDLTRDHERLLVVAHALQTAIQGVLDIGAHILADYPDSAWEEYRDIPTRLAGLGIVSAGLAESLRKMASMRNVLVHLYLDLDTEIVAGVLANDLADFAAFVGQVQAYLDRPTPSA